MAGSLCLLGSGSVRRLPSARPPRRCAILLGLVGLLGLLLSCPAQIPSGWERFVREQKVELYGIGQYLHSQDIKFSDSSGDIKVKMDDTGLGGFGMAYHINDFLAVRADFMFGGATFRAEGSAIGTTPLSAARDAVLQTGRLNLDYNLINRRFTPLITAGIGYQYLYAELDQYGSVPVCWWDPWWGYVCTYATPTYSEFDFTWNVGGGFRWNVTDHFFIKAVGGANWLQYSGANGITTQIEGIFALGWTF
jgi:opacity protein-like surface antigen